MPGCVAVTEHGPKATNETASTENPNSVTVLPQTAQTAGVVEAKLTGKPEVVTAEILKGTTAKPAVEGAERLMIWGVMPGAVCAREEAPATSAGQAIAVYCFAAPIARFPVPGVSLQVTRIWMRAAHRVLP